MADSMNELLGPKIYKPVPTGGTGLPAGLIPPARIRATHTGRSSSTSHTRAGPSFPVSPASSPRRNAISAETFRLADMRQTEDVEFP